MFGKKKKTMKLIKLKKEVVLNLKLMGWGEWTRENMIVT